MQHNDLDIKEAIEVLRPQFKKKSFLTLIFGINSIIFFWLVFLFIYQYNLSPWLVSTITSTTFETLKNILGYVVIVPLAGLALFQIVSLIYAINSKKFAMSGNMVIVFNILNRKPAVISVKYGYLLDLLYDTITFWLIYYVYDSFFFLALYTCVIIGTYLLIHPDKLFFNKNDMIFFANQYKNWKKNNQEEE